MTTPTINTRHTEWAGCDILLIGTTHTSTPLHEQIVNALEPHAPQAVLLESAPENKASDAAVGHRAAKDYVQLTGATLHVLRGTPHDTFGRLSDDERQRVTLAYKRTNNPSLTEDELDTHVENVKGTALQYYIDTITERNQEFALHTMSLIQQRNYRTIAVIVGKDHLPQLEAFLTSKRR